MKHIIGISIFLIIGFSACNKQKTIYEKTISFPNYEWNRFNIIEFSPEIKKLNKSYTFTLLLTYKEGLPYETLPVNTVLTYPSGQKNIIRHVFLIKKDNAYIGNKEGNLRHIEAIIHPDKIFSEEGLYTFSAQQLTQYYDLDYMVSVGCKVSYSSKKNKS